MALLGAERSGTDYPIEERGEDQCIRLPREYWHRRDEISLRFPRSWDVRVCRMEGDRSPLLDPDQLQQSICEPIGCAPLRELAVGKREVVIVVDDLTRPTRVEGIGRLVIDELLKAGVPEDGIRFIVSLGCHGAHDQEAFRKKLGDELVERFRVYNHNCYENCVDVGLTRRGIPLKINAEFMRCDLKIAIGAILPHLYVGYSGGGKIVLPGLAHIDTIECFHSSLTPDQKGRVGHDNPLCADIEDAVRLSGLDFKIDTLVNTRGDVIGLYAGRPDGVYREGIEDAREVYCSELFPDRDVVVTNAYIKANEGDIAMLLGFRALKKRGGTCVLILNSPGGQMTHYLMRSFGKFIGGRQWVTRSHLPEDTDLIVLSEYKDMTSFDSFDSQERIQWVKTWDEALSRLRASYSGAVKVGVIPDGTVQYFS